MILSINAELSRSFPHV